MMKPMLPPSASGAPIILTGASGAPIILTGASGAPIILTGASGALGRMLARELSAAGMTLRMTDITPFPDAMPAGASFTRADLNDGLTIARLAEGCGAILHFGGISVEQPFEEIFGPNLRGLYHIYEAARREKARMVFASSNHTIGYHQQGQSLDLDCQFRPDGFYGLSKAYGELMGRLYWDKHGVENVNLRIGTCLPEPRDARALSTWLSYPDLARLVRACVTAERAGHAVIWGASANPASWWAQDHRERIGWAPQDSAEVFRAQLEGVLNPSEVGRRHQGGAFCVHDHTRPTAPPRDAFSLE